MLPRSPERLGIVFLAIVLLFPLGILALSSGLGGLLADWRSDTGRTGWGLSSDVFQVLFMAFFTIGLVRRAIRAVARHGSDRDRARAARRASLAPRRRVIEDEFDLGLAP